MMRWLSLILLNLFWGYCLVAQPINDNVCDATALVMDVPTAFNNLNASAQFGEVNPGVGTDGPSSCRSQNGWCFFDAVVQNSVWFTFVAPPSGKVLVLADAVNVDLQLAIWYTPECSNFGSFVEMGANDDGNATTSFPLSPAMFSCDQNLIPGETYYLQIDGFDGAETADAEVLVVPYEPPIASITIEDCENEYATATIDGGLGEVSYSANGTIVDNGDGTLDITNIIGDSVILVAFDDVSALVTNIAPCEYSFATGMDVEPPRFIDCPTEDVVVATDMDACSAVVDFLAPSASDDICNIPIPSPIEVTLTVALDFIPLETSWEVRNSIGQLLYSAAYTGGDFGVQTHVMQLRKGEYEFSIFDSAGDGICCALGNGNWTIAYSDDDGAQTIQSPSNGQFGASESVTFSITTVEPPSPVSVTQVEGPSSGSTFPLGSTLIAFEAVDFAGLTSNCAYHITVQDEARPVVICPDDTTILFDEDSSPEFTGLLMAEDNCSVSITSFTDVTTQGNEGCSLYNYEISRTFDAVDGSGNVSSCTQTIVVQGPEPLVLDGYSIGLSDPSDCGLFDGTIMVSGLLGYEYEISSNPEVWSTTSVYSDLGPGTYTIRVRHPGVDCPDSFAELNNIQLNAPWPPALDNLSIDRNDPSNCGLSDGFIVLNGLPDYEYELNNSGEWTTSSEFNNLPAGWYTISVRNADGTCETDFAELIDLELVAPTSPTLDGFSIDRIDPSDCDLSDGFIVLDGLAGYEYELNYSGHWTSTPEFNELEAGWYTIRLRNVNGTCETEFADLTDLELVAPQPPNLDEISTTLSNPSDCSLSDGSIVLTGILGYEYELNGSGDWSSTPEFIDLASGSYTIGIRNADGSCATYYEELSDLELFAPEAPSLDGVSTALSDPSDCGLTDGSIVLTGLPEYEYELNGSGDWSSTPEFIDLASGSYTIGIRNADGSCTTYYEELSDLELVAPETPSLDGINTALSDPSDCGLSDGSIVLTGLSAYEYELNGSGDWRSTPEFIDLASGSYTIGIRNADGSCTTYYEELSNLELFAPEAPSLDGVSTALSDPSDCSLSNGSIVLTGLADYEYELNGSGEWSSTPTFDDLPAGLYTIGVRNADGSCATYYEQLNNLELVAPGVPNLDGISTALSDPSDCGLTDGSIVLTGLPEYEYELNGSGDWSSTPEFIDLASGSYTIGIRNADGSCTTYYEELSDLELVAPEAPSLDGINTALSDPSDCGLSDGSIVLTGLSAYEYELNGSGEWGSTPAFSDLASGSYTIGIRNADGSCATYYEELSDLELVAPETPSLDGINTALSDPSDCGLSDGSIVLTGLSAYEYELNGSGDWSSTPEFIDLASGSYTIGIRNADGSCAIYYEQLSDLELVAPEAPSLDGISTALMDPSDCGLSDGSIVLTGLSAYEYELNGSGEWGSTPAFSDLASGSYTIGIRNADGSCATYYEELSDLELVAPETPSLDGINTALSDPSDCGLSDGSIVLTGLADYEYELNGSGEWGSTPAFSDLASGSYTIGIRNADGSCATYYEELSDLELFAPEAPSLDGVSTALSDPSDCGLSDGSIVLTGLSAYEYQLNGSGEWGSTPAFSELASGSYTIGVRNADGSCATYYEQLSNLELVAPQAPSLDDISTALSDPSDCGLSDGSIVLTGLPAYEYELNGSGEWSSTSVFSELASGSYMIGVRNADGSCATYYEQLSDLELIAPEPPQLEDLSLIAQGPSDCDLIDGQLMIDGENAGDYEYSINGGDWTDETEFFNLGSGIFEIRVGLAGGRCPQLFELVSLSAPEAPSILAVEVQTPNQCVDEPVQLGQLTISASSNTGTLAYNFNYPDGEWQLSPTAENLTYGSYTVAVRNEDGTCEHVGETVDFADQGAFEVVTTEIAPVSDCYAEDGVISVETIGGSSDLQFSVDGGANWQPSPVFSNLTVGSYNILANDLLSGCYDNATAVLDAELDLSSFTITAVPASSCEIANGGIVILNTDENSYEYSLDDGVSWSLGPIIEGLPPGEYDVITRTLDLNCTAVLAEDVVVDAPPLPTLNDIAVNPTLSCEETTSDVVLTVDGSVESFLFSLDGGLSWQPEPDFVGVQPGEYQVMVQNRFSLCKSEAVLIVVEAVSEFMAQTAEIISPICPDIENGMINLEVSGGVAPYSYSWSTGSSDEQLIGLAGGQLYSCTVSDARGCISFVAVELLAATTFADWDVSLSDTTICENGALWIGVSLPEVADFYWEDDQGTIYEGADIVVEDAQQLFLNVVTLEGCLLSDSLNVNYDSTGREAYFLLPDEGVINAPIVAIDISNPVPDEIIWHYDVEWVEGEELTFNQHLLQFPNPGEYVVGMSANLGSCWTYLEKQIQIFATEEELSQELPGQAELSIQSFDLFPNPNEGVFQVSLQLNESLPARCWIFSDGGAQMYFEEMPTDVFHVIHFAQPEWAPGLYTVIIQVGEEYRHANFVIL